MGQILCPIGVKMNKNRLGFGLGSGNESHPRQAWAEKALAHYSEAPLGLGPQPCRFSCFSSFGDSSGGSSDLYLPLLGCIPSFLSPGVSLFPLSGFCSSPPLLCGGVRLVGKVGGQVLPEAWWTMTNLL